MREGDIQADAAEAAFGHRPPRLPGEASLPLTNLGRSLWLRLALMAASLFMLALIAFGVLSTGRPGTITWGPTTDFWAMSIAMTDINLGIHDGLGRREIVLELAKYLTSTGSDLVVQDDATRKMDSDPRLVDQAIRAAAALRPAGYPTWDSGAWVTTLAEDIGFADFYDGAFRIFGFGAYSTHYFYLVLLGLGALLFALGNWRSSAALALLSLVLTGLFLTTTSSSMFSESVPTLAANRFVSTLAIVPFFGIAMMALDPGPFSWPRRLALVAQLVLFSYSLQLRTSVQWSLAALLLLLVIVMIVRFPDFLRRHRGNRALGFLSNFFAVPELRRATVVCLLAVAAGLGYGTARVGELNLIYQGDDILPHHLRWHSALLGLSISPEWNGGADLGLNSTVGGDSIGWTAATSFINQFMPSIPITSPLSGGNLRMALVDRIEGAQFLRFARAHPGYLLRLYFIYKPLQMAKVLSATVASIRALAWLLALPGVLLAAIALAGLASRWLLLEISSLVAGGFLCSLLPLWWAYADSYLVADQATTLLTLVGFAGSLVLALAASLVVRKGRAAPLAAGMAEDRDL